jgi:hypothetical protein
MPDLIDPVVLHTILAAVAFASFEGTLIIFDFLDRVVVVHRLVFELLYAVKTTRSPK